MATFKFPFEALDSAMEVPVPIVEAVSAAEGVMEEAREGARDGRSGR